MKSSGEAAYEAYAYVQCTSAVPPIEYFMPWECLLDWEKEAWQATADVGAKSEREAIVKWLREERVRLAKLGASESNTRMSNEHYCAAHRCDMCSELIRDGYHLGKR